MSQNSAAHLAKVECAVKEHLLKLSALTVLQAMNKLLALLRLMPVR
jgi:hypothetical protein